MVSFMSIRRFHTSDQLMHMSNAMYWVVLAVSGFLMALAKVNGVNPEHQVVGAHFLAGLVLLLAIILYALFARHRMTRLFHEILRRDRPFWAWMRVLGGYPQKFLKRPAPQVEQGRFNAGQKVAYGILILSNILLVVSGLALFFLHQPAQEQSSLYQTFLVVHSLAFGVALPVALVHILMAFANLAQLKAIGNIGSGLISYEEGLKHASIWVKEDLEPESAAVLRERLLK